VAYDDSRISRGAYEQIVKSIIFYSGASVYRIVGGWITDDNIEFQAALGGIKANAGMKEWIRKRKLAMSGRARRGLLTGNRQDQAPTNFPRIRLMSQPEIASSN